MRKSCLGKPGLNGEETGSRLAGGAFLHINTLARFTGVADGYQPMTGAIHMKTMSRDPLLPRQTGLLASYKMSKISALATRRCRQSRAKAGYIFTQIGPKRYTWKCSLANTATNASFSIAI